MNWVLFSCLTFGFFLAVTTGDSDNEPKMFTEFEIKKICAAVVTEKLNAIKPELRGPPGPPGISLEGVKGAKGERGESCPQTFYPAVAVQKGQQKSKGDPAGIWVLDQL